MKSKNKKQIIRDQLIDLIQTSHSYSANDLFALFEDWIRLHASSQMQREEVIKKAKLVMELEKIDD